MQQSWNELVDLNLDVDICLIILLLFVFMVCIIRWEMDKTSIV